MSTTAVVVGVSTADSRPEVRWAAEEAVARKAELRLVTATRQGQAPRGVTAGWVLASEAAAAWPQLTVTTDIATGPPAAVTRARSWRPSVDRYPVSC